MALEEYNKFRSKVVRILDEKFGLEMSDIREDQAKQAFMEGMPAEDFMAWVQDKYGLVDVRGGNYSKTTRG